MSTAKRAIVTGGARGIGLVITQALVGWGVKVVICSRTESDISSALEKLNSSKKMVWGVKTDVSKFDQCRQLVDYSRRVLGGVDILVNNAGIYGPIGTLEQNSPRLWKQTLEINLLGMVYCSQLVLPQMKRRKRGKIINLCGGGVGGSRSLPRISAYYTSKVAVAGFTEVLAEETLDFNIQVNCIAPGAVNTYQTDYLISQGPKRAGSEFYQKAVDQKKSGGSSPQLVVNLIKFLISPQARRLTGRLLSAKWDAIDDLAKQSLSSNTYRLRRIGGNLFKEMAV